MYTIIYLLPVPTMYVLVPCSVIGLGLSPRTLITRGDNSFTKGSVSNDTAILFYFRDTWDTMVIIS